MFNSRNLYHRVELLILFYDDLTLNKNIFDMIIKIIYNNNSKYNNNSNNNSK